MVWLFDVAIDGSSVDERDFLVNVLRMKPGKILSYVILAVVAANLAIVAVAFLPALSSTKPTPMPNPNGYDDFVKAGQALTVKINDYSTMSRQELADLVGGNETVLKLLRSGLSHECRVPNNYSKDYFIGMSTVLISFKQCHFLLCAEGRLAQFDGRTNDAAKIYLDIVAPAAGKSLLWAWISAGWFWQ